MSALLEQINQDVARRQCERRAEYETLVELTGMSIARLDADLTAPDNYVPFEPLRWCDDCDCFATDEICCECGCPTHEL